MIFFIFLSCTSEYVSDINNKNHITCHSHEYGGWSKDICIRGNLIGNNYYQKIVFTDTIKGVIRYFVTKNAYVVSCINFDIKTDYHGKEASKVLVLSVKRKKDKINLMQCTKQWYLGSYIHFYTRDVTYFLDRIAYTCCKEEYDKWMIRHPETEILKY